MDSSKEEMLTELGLSKNDSKVYLALLKNGSNSISSVAKVSSIHRANVYEAISRLKSKGLVSEVAINGKKMYLAAEPSALHTIILEKELKLKSLLPELLLDYELRRSSDIVEVLEGVKAIRDIIRRYLRIGKDIYLFGVPKIAIQLVGDYYQNNIHKERAKQKQWMYHIYNSDAMGRIKYLNTLPYTKARYLTSNHDFPVTTRMCGDEVSITLYSQKPLTFVIRSKEMAESYRKYFQILWENAKD